MDIEAKVTIEGTNIESYLNDKISNMLNVNSAYEMIAEDVMDRLEWRTIDDIDSELDWDSNVMSVFDDNINTITNAVCEDIDWHYQISSHVDWDDIVREAMPEFSFEEELRGLMKIYSPQTPCETSQLATHIVKEAVTHLIANDIDFKESIKKALSSEDTQITIPAITSGISNDGKTTADISLDKDEVMSIISASVAVVRMRNGINFDTNTAIDAIIRNLPDKIRNFITPSN